MIADKETRLGPLLTENSDGTPCFTGTQVPVRLLIDQLAKGYTIYEFLLAFPTVRRQQVLAFLEAAAGSLSLQPR